MSERSRKILFKALNREVDDSPSFDHFSKKKIESAACNTNIDKENLENGTKGSNCQSHKSPEKKVPKACSSNEKEYLPTALELTSSPVNKVKNIISVYNQSSLNQGILDIDSINDFMYINESIDLQFLDCSFRSNTFNNIDLAETEKENNSEVDIQLEIINNDVAAKDKQIETQECDAQNLNGNMGENHEVVKLQNSNGTKEAVANQFETLTKKGNIRKRKTVTATTTAPERKKIKMEEKRKKYRVKASCNGCSKNCTEKISQDRREDINNKFWDMDWSKQRQFILNNTEKVAVIRKKMGSTRNNTYHYYLFDNVGKRYTVCKIFFLTTLGFNQNNDTVVQNALKNSEDHITLKPDMRGKNPCTKKIDRTNLVTHILSFRPCISHYRREHAPNRKYLPSDISPKLMYKDFKKKYPNIECSYDLYRNVIKEQNIAFTKLGHEECEICTKFKMHEHSKEDMVASCLICSSFANHQEKSKTSREEYGRDSENQRNSDDICVSPDLQKVIMLPRMEEFKIAIFTPRIIVFNETFVPVGKKQRHIKPFVSIWHEAVAGRKKEDIISTFHAYFLSQRDVKKITIWLDNCSAQNKNWCFFSFLICQVNSSQIQCEEIIIKYFEPGHTFMSADSFHHQVELSMKHKKVYDFDDFKHVVQQANSGNVDVKEMSVQDFFNWNDHSSQAKIKKAQPRPYVADIVKISVRRGELPAITWKQKALHLILLKGILQKPGYLQRHHQDLYQEEYRLLKNNQS